MAREKVISIDHTHRRPLKLAISIPEKPVYSLHRELPQFLLNICFLFF